MPPAVRSTTFAPPLTGFVPRSRRWMSLDTVIDMGNLPTLGDRMVSAMRVALIARLGVVARLVVMRATTKLTPGHGVDTGLMQQSLVATLVAAAEAMDYVAYDLESHEADYWVWVEFGHMMANGQFWEGYRFLTSSVMEMEPQIRQAVREAFADTVVALAGETAVSSFRRLL